MPKASSMIDEPLRFLIQQALSQEEETAAPMAALSKNRSTEHLESFDYRLPYRKDVDRIVQSKAYARCADKTQVVYLVADDHITHRVLHVQLVSQFARGLASMLKLNMDLAEAISLGHDVGHPPFGHEGEEYLSELSIEYGNGPFTHNYQSCRIFREIEPLNLGLAVYDGFLCHSGGLVTPHLRPDVKKSWDIHLQECELRKSHPKLHFFPATLEGCLVKLCDKICYIGRDIEDAVYLGIIKRAEVPSTILGDTNQEILQVAAADLIQQSYGKDEIRLSHEVFEALTILRKFNFEKIYNHPKIKVESKKIKHSFRILFELLLEDVKKNGEKGYLWLSFLNDKTQNYLEYTSDVQKVVDYIAGMTDNFFIRTFEKLVFPKSIEMQKC